MANVVFSLAALFMSLALLISGSAMLGTLVSLRLELEGISDARIGMVFALYSLGFVFGATWGTAIIRNVGHIRAFATFAAIACAVTLLHPMIVSVEAWGMMRLVMGFCLAGLMTVTESWINDRATNESRGKLLGFYTINFYLASSLGQLLVGFSNPAGVAAFSVVAILVVLSLVPLSLTRGLVPLTPSHTASLGLRQLLANAPAGVTGVLVAGIALGAFLALAPLYALRQGMDTSLLSRYMGFSVICAVLLQWPAGWLSDRLGRLPVLVGLLLSGAAASMVTALLGGLSVTAMFVFSGVFFAVATSMYPVSVALANDQLPNDQLVAACAALLRIYGVGTIVGPLAGAAVMGLFGAWALFAFISLCLLAAGVVIHVLFRRVDHVPLEEQGDYAPVVPVSSPVIVELDPRNEEFEAHHSGEPAEWDIADHIEMLLPVPDTEVSEAETLEPEPSLDAPRSDSEAPKVNGKADSEK